MHGKKWPPPWECLEYYQVSRVPPSGSGDENPMSSPGSVSHWISALKDGDSAAAQQLWERYYRRLVALARKKLQFRHCPAADEEDVVQNAFHSFFHAVAQGRFPQLDDRDSLWRLLVVITANKALQQLRHEHRQKRDVRQRVAMLERIVQDLHVGRGAVDQRGILVGTQLQTQGFRRGSARELVGQGEFQRVGLLAFQQEHIELFAPGHVR